MKVDLADQSTKRIKDTDRSKKNQISTYEFLKLNSDVAEAEQEATKNRNDYTSIHKDSIFNDQRVGNKSNLHNQHIILSPNQPYLHYTLNTPAELPLKQQFSNENLDDQDKIVHAIYSYESAVIFNQQNNNSTDPKTFSRKQYFSNTSIPTEVKVNLKSPLSINSPNLLNLLNQNENYTKCYASDTQKFLKTKNIKQNLILDEYSQKEKEGKQQDINIFNQNSLNSEKINDPEQQSQQEQIQNSNQLNEANNNRQSRNTSIQIPYPSQNSGKESYQTLKNIKDIKSKQQSLTNIKAITKTDKINKLQQSKESRIRQQSTSKTNSDKEQEQNSAILQNFQSSKADISSSNELQKSCNSNSSSIAAFNSMQASESAFQRQIHRNFSIFKRLQEQSQIEEKISQEDETMKFHQKANNGQEQNFTFYKSNSFSVSQHRQNLYSKYKKQKSLPKKKSFRYYSPQLSPESLKNTFNLSISLIVNQDDKNQQLSPSKRYEQSWKTEKENLQLNLEFPYLYQEENKDEIQSTEFFRDDNYTTQDQVNKQLNSASKQQVKNGSNIQRGKSSEHKIDQMSSRLTLPPLVFQRNQTISHSYTDKQKTKLYKNILKYLPEEGVILIDKNHNIHFANVFIQYLFPKSSNRTLFGELVQLKSIETLENYKHYLDEIIAQKQQNQTENKWKNFNQNLSVGQLTNSINLQQNQDQHNNNLQYNYFQAQNQTFQSQQKHQSKSSLKNINIGQSFSNQTINLNQKIIREQASTNNIQLQPNQNTQTVLQQQTSNYINHSSNHNLPIYSFGTHPNSSASMFPNTKLSQSNYFLKLDLFKDKEQLYQLREKEQFQLREKEQQQQQFAKEKELNDNKIRCKSFLELFEQMIQSFQSQGSSYKQYGIISQNKFTSLFYRSYSVKIFQYLI